MINKLSSMYKVIICLIFTVQTISSASAYSCLEADDVGQVLSYSVDSFVPAGSSKFMSLNGESGENPKYNQIIQWEDTNYITDGKPLVLEITGKWSSWNGSGGKMPKNGLAVPEDRICSNFSNFTRDLPTGLTTSCSRIADGQINNDITDPSGAKLYGAPCWFNNGYGLYIMFFTKNKEYKDKLSLILRQKSGNDVIVARRSLEQSMHPNATLQEMSNSTYPSFHAKFDPHKNGGRMWSNEMVIIDPITGKNITQLEPNWGIYVKILDRFYYDNVGAFDIKFISGVQVYNSKNAPFSWLNKIIMYALKDAARKIFSNTTQSDHYKNFINACFLLFVTFTGMSYLLGTAQLSTADAFMRVLKIGILLLLLSPISWDFFYDHFFSLYVDGTSQIIGTIASRINSYSAQNPVYFLDRFWIEVFNSHTWLKIGAVVLSTATGIVWCLVLIGVLLVLIIASIFAFNVYIIAMMAVFLMISLAPIFMVAILFKPLKPIFDGWLTTLMNYSLQAVMIFALVIFILTMALNYLHQSLGFRACYQSAFTCSLNVGGLPLTIIPEIKAWIVGGGDFKIINPCSPSLDGLHNSGRSFRYTIVEDMAEIPTPPDYINKERRYIHLPFYNPELVPDRNRLNQILHKGNLVDLDAAFAMLAISIMALFMKRIAVQIGQVVSGGDAFASNISSAYDGFFQQGGFKFNPMNYLHAAKTGMQDAMGSKLDRAHRALMKPMDPLFKDTSSVAGKTKEKVRESNRYQNIKKTQDRIGGSIDFAGNKAKEIPTDVAKGLGKNALYLASAGNRAIPQSLQNRGFKGEGLQYWKDEAAKIKGLPNAYKDHIEATQHIYGSNRFKTTDDMAETSVRDLSASRGGAKGMDGPDASDYRDEELAAVRKRNNEGEDAAPEHEIKRDTKTTKDKLLVEDDEPSLLRQEQETDNTDDNRDRSEKEREEEEERREKEEEERKRREEEERERREREEEQKKDKEEEDKLTKKDDIEQKRRKKKVIKDGKEVEEDD